MHSFAKGIFLKDSFCKNEKNIDKIPNLGLLAFPPLLIPHLFKSLFPGGEKEIKEGTEVGDEVAVSGGNELDDELNSRAWKDTLPRFALRQFAVDYIRYERFEKFLYDAKLIKQKINIIEVIIYYTN